MATFAVMENLVADVLSLEHGDLCDFLTGLELSLEEAMLSPVQDIKAAVEENNEETALAEYNPNEERRKVLQMSTNKLRSINDPESRLCYSVLINNTMNELKKEAREEEMQHHINAYSNTFFLDGQEYQVSNSSNSVDITVVRETEKVSAKCQLKEKRKEILKMATNKLKQIYDPESELRHSVLLHNTMRRLKKEAKEEKMLKKMNVDQKESQKTKRRYLTEDEFTSGILRNNDDIEFGSAPECDLKETACEDSNKERLDLDGLEDFDIDEVFSQFYLSSTPPLLTSIDSDIHDELNLDEHLNLEVARFTGEQSMSEECQPPCKKPKLESSKMCGDKFLSYEPAKLLV